MIKREVVSETNEQVGVGGNLNLVNVLVDGVLVIPVCRHVVKRSDFHPRAEQNLGSTRCVGKFASAAWPVLIAPVTDKLTEQCDFTRDREINAQVGKAFRSEVKTLGAVGVELQGHAGLQQHLFLDRTQR